MQQATLPQMTGSVAGGDGRRFSCSGKTVCQNLSRADFIPTVVEVLRIDDGNGHCIVRTF